MVQILALQYRSGSSISKSEAGSVAQIAMLMMSGIGGMGMVMACYEKVFMRQLDEKVQLLDEKLMAISKRASDLSYSASNIERRMDEGGGQVRDRLRHLVQRLADLRVLMRWGPKMRDWLRV